MTYSRAEVDRAASPSRVQVLRWDSVDTLSEYVGLHASRRSRSIVFNTCDSIRFDVVALFDIGWDRPLSRNGLPGDQSSGTAKRIRKRRTI